MKKLFSILLTVLFTVGIFACPMDGKVKDKTKGKNPTTVQTG